MKKTIISTLLLIALLLVGNIAHAQSVPKATINHLYNSVALLYTQDAAGDMRMTCSVTAFATKAAPADSKPGEKIYRFASAAHCVEGSNDKQQKLQKFYISADTKGTKAYFPATLVGTGDKTVGDDFSLFEIITADAFDVAPLGDSTSLSIGDSVIDVSGALGFGKQYFQGYVSELHLDRPPVNAGVVQWTDIMLIQIGGGPGSSGSAVVSTSQNAIVGFLVGMVGEGDVGKLCVPSAKFSAFVKAVDAGTYKKSKVSDNDAAPSDDTGN